MDSAIDNKRLSSLETVIESGLRTFSEVGNALLEIRDARLYRATHGTFEDYCRERWGFQKAHAYRLMESAKVVGNLSPMGDVPSNERQVRQLAKLAPAEQPKAWQEATEKAATEGRKVTARDVEQAVAVRIEPTKPKQEETKKVTIKIGAMAIADKAKWILTGISYEHKDREDALRSIISWCQDELRR